MIVNAVIFDLNGTILDDEDEYGEAFNRVLKKFGVESGSKYPHESGIGVKENWKKFIEKYSIKTNKTPDELAAYTQKEYLDQLGSLRVRPGFFDFVENLKDSGISTALATSNSWETMEKILEAINVNPEIFNAITTTEEVKFNKPDPEIFLVTAEKLGIPPEECVVIEDAQAGVTAAHEGGMKVIAIARNDEYAAKLKKADLVIEGYAEITPKILYDLASS